MVAEILTRLQTAVAALEAKKAFQVLALDVSTQTSVADVLLFCSVGSARQAQAVADEVERALRDLGDRPASVEGYGQGSWVLLDYGDLIVHVFLEERREYYGLERLWGDATDITASLRPPA